jgi:hypothetical protein
MARRELGERHEMHRKRSAGDWDEQAGGKIGDRLRRLVRCEAVDVVDTVIGELAVQG